MQAEEIKAVLRDRLPLHPILAEHDERGHWYRYLNNGQLYPSVTGILSVLAGSDNLKKWAARLAVEHYEKHWRYGMKEDERELLRKASILAHQDAFEDAGHVGNFGHDIVENYLKDWMKTGERPIDIRTYVGHEDSRRWAIARSAEMFCKDFFIEPIASELLVASPKYGFAGTLDSLMMVAKTLTKSKDPNCGHHFISSSTKNPNRRMCATLGGQCGMEIEMELVLVDFKTSNSIDKEEYAVQVSAYAAALKEMVGIKVKHLMILRLDKEKAKYEMLRVEHPSEAFRAFKACNKIYGWKTNRKEKLNRWVEKQTIKIGSVSQEARSEAGERPVEQGQVASGSEGK